MFVIIHIMEQLVVCNNTLKGRQFLLTFQYVLFYFTASDTVMVTFCSLMNKVTLPLRTFGYFSELRSRTTLKLMLNQVFDLLVTQLRCELNNNTIILKFKRGNW